MNKIEIGFIPAREFLSLLLWWLTFSTTWGLFRLFQTSEFFSELIAKPIIWLGITVLFINLSLIPIKVIENFRGNYLNIRPFLQVFLLPTIFILAYFFAINFRIVHLPKFSWEFLVITWIINFATGIVEEIIYRGILYTWLIKLKGEVWAFILVQLLFLVGHFPTLVINSDSVSAALTHAFFIVLMGSIHTGIFRLTKSLYASAFSHGLWNSLVYYFMIN